MNRDISSHHMKTRLKAGQNTRAYQLLKTKNSKLCVKFKVPYELQYILDKGKNIMTVNILQMSLTKFNWNFRQNVINLMPNQPILNR